MALRRCKRAVAAARERAAAGAVQKVDGCPAARRFQAGKHATLRAPRSVSIRLVGIGAGQGTAGVAAIPMSAFCDPHGAPETWNHLVRFAFCKRDETLDEAIRCLRVLGS